MSAWLDTAMAAARAAGAVLRRKFRAPRAVQSKGWRDIVTDADLAAQHAALTLITTRYPRHRILSEEGVDAADLTANTPTWILDPLDGTTNYSRQLPLFCVSLALVRAGTVRAGTVRVGVIYDPLRRELFYAERGRGAWRCADGGAPTRLRVSTVTEFSGATLAMDWARDPGVRQELLDCLNHVAHAGRSVRALGSAALALAYVAAGALDGYFSFALQPWDMAAGGLLITEAGGEISDPMGAAWQLRAPRVVASNGRLHKALIATLALR